MLLAHLKYHCTHSNFGKIYLVSRLSLDTTPAAVKNHLCSKLNATPDNFIINKFDFNHARKISLYKLFFHTVSYLKL